MDTITVQMELPKNVLVAANISEVSASESLKRMLALFLFKERILSLGKSVELSGVDKLGFIEYASSMKVSLNYDVDDYLEDLDSIEAHCS